MLNLGDETHVDVAGMLEAFESEMRHLHQEARTRWEHYQENHGDTSIPDFMHAFLFNAGIEGAKLGLALTTLALTYATHLQGHHDLEQEIVTQADDIMTAIAHVCNVRAGVPPDHERPSSN